MINILIKSNKNKASVFSYMCNYKLHTCVNNSKTLCCINSWGCGHRVLSMVNDDCVARGGKRRYLINVDSREAYNN